MKSFLRKYDLKSEFDFGSFVGNSIETVFRGNPYPAIETLRKGLLKELEQCGLGNLSEALKVIKVENRHVFAIEINPIKTLRLSMLTNQGHTFSCSSQNFWYLFSIERKYSQPPLDEIENVFPFVLTLGHPEYISWCMSSVDWFSLSEKSILFMSKNQYLSRVNFTSFFIHSNMYILPHLEWSNYQISSVDLTANRRKQQSIVQ